VAPVVSITNPEPQMIVPDFVERSLRGLLDRDDG
jgi:hypothetical protein